MIEPNPIPAGITRANLKMARSPTVSVVRSSDDPDGYTFASPQTPTSSGGGWFSGLRQKISLLSGMSEWLSQLGIGANHNDGTIKQQMEPSSTFYSSPTSSHPPTESLLPGEGYDDSTGFSFSSITLEDCPTDATMKPDLGWLDFSAREFCADTLERQHFGPLRDLLTVGGQRGQGHEFQPLSVLQPTWCDKCGDFILFGFVLSAVKCKKCNYTCHDRCQTLVTLDCRSTNSSCDSQEFPTLYPKLDGTLGTIPKGTILPELPEIPEEGQRTTDSDKENGCFKNPLFKSPSATVPRNFAPILTEFNAEKPLRIEEIYVKEDTPFEFAPESEDRLAEVIDEYNRHAEGLGMTLNEDGSSAFTGYLHIHMNFTRPINVVAGEQPPTMYDVVNTGKSTMSSTLRTITSFFLPRHTVKTVNITSQMTTRQMIVTLLRKFRVADNPRKFALYQCADEVDQDAATLRRRLTRIADDACPLQVALLWGSPQCGKHFVLQENDTGDILWDAFEVPELENFLRILKMEEQQYNYQIRQKYNSYRYYLDQELRTRGHPVEDRSSAPPLELAPPPPPPVDYYGTSDSMVFHSLKGAVGNQEVEPEEEGENPIYMNLSFLRNNDMEQSTRL